ncbi:MAG TPA: hypothetical protein VFK47_01775, partial [Ktedonobacteraceae bacterium]|nr:hypothetical protein [Ktedonobacteraceae bacterium]
MALANAAQYTGRLASIGDQAESPNQQLPVDHRHYDGTNPGAYPGNFTAPPMGSEFIGTGFDDMMDHTSGSDLHMIEANINTPAVYVNYHDRQTQDNTYGYVQNNADDDRKLLNRNPYYKKANEHYGNPEYQDNPDNTQNMNALALGLNSLPEATPFSGSQRISSRWRNQTQNITRMTNEHRTYEPVPLYTLNAVASNAVGSSSNAGTTYGNYFPSAQRFQTKQQMVPFMYR